MSGRLLNREEAVEYLHDHGLTTHGVWRDLRRNGLKYTEQHQKNLVTEDTLDRLIEICLEKKENDEQGKKLEDFAPNASDEWRAMCENAARRRALRIEIAHIRNRR